MVDCLLQTTKHEGIVGLYKGMAAPLVGVAFVNAVLFSAYGWCKSIQTSSNHELSLWQIALAGSSAGFVNSFVAGPIELIKIRLQMQREKVIGHGGYAGPIDVALRLIREKGVFKCLFRGTCATIVKEIPVIY